MAGVRRAPAIAVVPLDITKHPESYSVDQQHVIFEREGPVGWLTFNRPEARNAMTFAMYQRLVDVCEEVDADRSLRVLVLRGAGDKAFVAGTDISQFRAFSTTADALGYEERMDGVIGRLESLGKPAIAMVRGYAVGGGAAIAMACDLRICAPSARFGVPIARTLGNCLSMSNYNRLVDLIGPSRAKEIIFTARLIDAQQALAAGLANEVVESEEDLEPRVREVAHTIAANAPLTIAATKKAVAAILRRRRLPREEGDELVLSCFLSKDFQEGVAAFLEKRKPQWRGE